MSYTSIISSSVSNPDTVTDNFYHVGQGNLYPMTATSFAVTDQTGTLGNTASVWNVLFCDTFSCESITANGNFKTLLATYASVATVTSITFSGLAGGRYYEMVLNTNLGSTGSWIILNNTLSTDFGYFTFFLSPTVAACFGTISTGDVAIRSMSRIANQNMIKYKIFDIDQKTKNVKIEHLVSNGNTTYSMYLMSYTEGFCTNPTTVSEILLLGNFYNVQVNLWSVK